MSREGVGSGQVGRGGVIHFAQKHRKMGERGFCRKCHHSTGVRGDGGDILKEMQRQFEALVLSKSGVRSDLYFRRTSLDRRG